MFFFILSIKMAYQHTTQQPHHQMLCRITPTRQDWVPDRNESPSTVHHTQGIATANVSLFLPYHFSFFTNVLTEAIKVLFTGREGFP